MKKLHQEILINAPRQKVWKSIIEDKPYREWTAAFMPGSYFEGNWSKGSKIRFLAKDDKGQIGGMTSEIADNKPNEFISIRHLGIVTNGKDDTQSPEAKKWAPAYENYTLKDEGGKTRFILDMDVAEEMEAEFKTMWPKAMQKLKEVSERAA